MRRIEYVRDHAPPDDSFSAREVGVLRYDHRAAFALNLGARVGGNGRDDLARAHKYVCDERAIDRRILESKGALVDGHVDGNLWRAKESVRNARKA